jgi:hypothetical protein
VTRGGWPQHLSVNRAELGIADGVTRFFGQFIEAALIFVVAFGDERLVQRPANPAVERTEATGLLDRGQYGLRIDQHRERVTDDYGYGVLGVVHSKLHPGVCRWLQL